MGSGGSFSLWNCGVSCLRDQIPYSVLLLSVCSRYMCMGVVATGLESLPSQHGFSPPKQTKPWLKFLYLLTATESHEQACVCDCSQSLADIIVMAVIWLASMHELHVADAYVP